MDAPDIPAATLEKFHRDLDRVHSILATFRTVRLALQRDPAPIISVLDIGCGGGGLLKYLQRTMKVRIAGVDRMPPAGLDFPCAAADACFDPLPPADVAVSTMMSHHLTRDQNIALIRNVARSSRRFVIVDLIRHPLPLALFTAFVCPFIGHEAAADGRQSIRRAFTPDEFSDIAKAALSGTRGTFSIDVSPFRSRQIVDIRFS
jgi:SAM-dependent methyltransferase